MLLLSWLLINPNVDLLGAEDYWARERAESRLRWLGPLAWPQLIQAQESDSPEVRLRVWRLLPQYRDLRMTLQAAAILAGHKCDVPSLYASDRLRARLYKVAIANGCPDLGTYYAGAGAHHLNPDNDDTWNWWAPTSSRGPFAASLAGCQAFIATKLKGQR